jgi:hypothetical protein
MARARTVRPTDLVALVAYDGRVYPNEAVTRDRVGTEAAPHPLEAALEQWFSFATGRHTWISIKGATLRGLISARRRGSNAAWEIDCLIDAADDDSGVLMSLLDQVASDAGRARAEKIFLRVPVASDVIGTARSTGFVPYATERLLAAGPDRDRTTTVTPIDGVTFRRWAKADAEPTFRLYNRWMPETVRRSEAVTFREWLAARERISPTHGTYQQVVEHDGRIAGWLRAAATGEAGRFDVMADPDQPELLGALIDAAVARLREPAALYTLVPEFATGLRERLIERGFVEQGEFALLARRTVRTAPEPQVARMPTVQFFPA